MSTLTAVRPARRPVAIITDPVTDARDTIDMAITEALGLVDLYELQRIIGDRLSEEVGPTTGQPLTARVIFKNRLTGEIS